MSAEEKQENRRLIFRGSLGDLFSQPARNLVGIHFDKKSDCDKYFSYLLEHDIDTELVGPRTLVTHQNDFSRIGVPTHGSYRPVPVVNGPTSDAKQAYLVRIPDAEECESALERIGVYGPIRSLMYEGNEIFRISAKQHKFLKKQEIKFEEV